MTYSASSNSGSSTRSTTLTVAGQTFTVNESGQTSPAIFNSHDFNGDGKPDLLWRHQTAGSIGVWFMNGGTTMASSSMLTPSSVTDLDWQIVCIADFNSDGKPDILWQHQTTGQMNVWFMNETAMTSSTLLTPSSVGDTNWKVVGFTDFNGDGHPDLVWQHQTAGTIAVWFMNGTTMTSSTLFIPGVVSDTNWKIVGR
ncbi:MAG TPA: VCBS repeat-containing protein [Syntrophales bacterium]|nr:VCBS repeat-containing protein [Syntrophales bacterium]